MTGGEILAVIVAVGVTVALVGSITVLTVVVVGVLLGAALIGALTVSFALFLPVLAYLLLILWAVKIGLDEQRRHEARLRELGLTPIAGGWRGEIDGVEVFYGVRPGKPPTYCWSVAAPTGTLSIRMQGSGQLTGDPRCDVRFGVRGIPADRALLSASVRQALRDMQLVTVEQGRLERHSRFFRLQHLRELIALADALREAPEPVERLRNLTGEPLAGVRLHGLLAAHEHDEALGRELADRLRQDEDVSVRALASVLLEEEGLEDIVAWDEVKELVRVRAIEVLLHKGTPLQQRLAGQRLLCRSSHQARGLELLRASGPEEDALLEVLPRIDGEMLGQILLMLREVGTVAAVPALRARQAKLSAIQTGLSVAIDQAVLAIQQGSGGVRGGLAVAGSPSEQGALSLAPERGRLSLREGA